MTILLLEVTNMTLKDRIKKIAEDNKKNVVLFPKLPIQRPITTIEERVSLLEDAMLESLVNENGS
jgi:hypothetical protein